MSEIRGYLTREQVDDLSRVFSPKYGYNPLGGRANYLITGSKGAAQIDEAIRRELEEERGVELRTNRKHITLQLSFDDKEYVTEKQWQKKLMTAINEAANEINKRSLRGSGNYLYTYGVSVFDPKKMFTLTPSFI